MVRTVKMDKFSTLLDELNAALVVGMDTSVWAGNLREIAALIGAREAVLLADAVGGVKKYIPVHATPGHDLAHLIGLDKLETLCQAIGGRYVEIPRGTYRDLKKAKIAEGAGTISNRKLALRTRVTDRYVRRVRAMCDAEARSPQGNLFVKSAPPQT